MGTGKSRLYENAVGNLKPYYLIEELRKSGKKFTEKDIVMITKTKKVNLFG